MPKRRGADGRLFIGLPPDPGGNLILGWWVGYQRFEITDRTTSLPVTDSELRPGNYKWNSFDNTLKPPPNNKDFLTADRDAFVAKIGDLRECTVRFLNATWSEENNVFGPPLVMHSNKWYVVELYPNRENLSYGFLLGNMLCVSAGIAPIIPGAMPVTIEFESDGSFRFPHELDGVPAGNVAAVPPHEAVELATFTGGGGGGGFFTEGDAGDEFFFNDDVG